MKQSSPVGAERQQTQQAQPAADLSHSEDALSFTDNRPEALAQRKLKETINISPQMQAQRKQAAMFNNSPRMAAQRKLHAPMNSSAKQLQAAPQEEELLQGKFAPDSFVQLKEEPTSRPNNTGLPDNLKNGIESLSGISMDNVKVHYNSSQPAQLNALAYAQGTDIHVAPGKEQHLPHEAWHVVQQAQGRVQPTMQMKDGVQVNNDAGLEREADLMGVKALRLNHASSRDDQLRMCQTGALERQPIQCLTSVGGNIQTPHALMGPAQISAEMPVNQQANGDRGVIIELMEGNANSAIAKIDEIHNSANNTDNRAIIIGLNRRAGSNDIENNRLRANRNFRNYVPLVTDANRVAQHAENHNVQGGCFPAIWAPTGDGGGYTFPFLEMRSQVTLHPGTLTLIDRLRDATGINPVMRSMDADVTNDPLLASPLSNLAVSSQKALTDLGRVKWDERQVGNEDVVADFSIKGADIVTGGYRWDTTAKDANFWGDEFNLRGATWNRKLTDCLDLINQSEHDVRGNYARLLPKAIYWPEPNTYMDSQARLEGAEAALQAGQAAGVQQRESTYYIRNIGEMIGHYNPELQTTKPLKAYFNPLRDIIKTGVINHAEIRTLVQEVRQTHFSPEHIQHILAWNNKLGVDDNLMQALEAIRLNIMNRLVGDLVRVLKRDG